MASSVFLADEGISTKNETSSESPSFKSSIVYLLKDTTQALHDSHTSKFNLTSSGSEPVFVTDIVYVNIEPGFPLKLFSEVDKETSRMGNLTEVFTNKSSPNCSLFVEEI